MESQSPTSPGGARCRGAKRWPTPGRTSRIGSPARRRRRRFPLVGFDHAGARRSRSSEPMRFRSATIASRATCSPTSSTSSAETPSTKKPSGARVFFDREAGGAARQLLDDEVVRPFLDDLLVLGQLVALDDEEALRVGPHLFVFGKRHAKAFDARGGSALTHELGLLGDEAEALTDLPQ